MNDAAPLHNALQAPLIAQVDGVSAGEDPAEDAHAAARYLLGLVGLSAFGQAS